MINDRTYEHATVTLTRPGEEPILLEGVKSISYRPEPRPQVLGPVAVTWNVELECLQSWDTLARIFAPSRYQERRGESWRARANRKIRRRYGAWCRVSRAVRLGLLR